MYYITGLYRISYIYTCICARVVNANLVILIWQPLPSDKRHWWYFSDARLNCKAVSATSQVT